MVTVFEVEPPIEITTGTALPSADASGTTTLTWYSPTYPGARPANNTEADAPPTVTVGSLVVVESGLPGPGDPVAG